MIYECEVCGKKEELTETEAFNQGWDYPPFMGVWGIVSARTCGDCPITKTAWWFIAVDHRGNVSGITEIPENHLRTINRILEEVNEHDTTSTLG